MKNTSRLVLFLDYEMLHCKLDFLSLIFCTSQNHLWRVPVQCLAAGSIIMNREIESIAMRPLAKDLTRSLEEVRNITRDQALRDLNLYTDRMKDVLRHFDILFAEFELRYV